MHQNPSIYLDITLSATIRGSRCWGLRGYPCGIHTVVNSCHRDYQGFLWGEGAKRREDAIASSSIVFALFVTLFIGVRGDGEEYAVNITSRGPHYSSASLHSSIRTWHRCFMSSKIRSWENRRLRPNDTPAS